MGHFYIYTCYGPYKQDNINTKRVLIKFIGIIYCIFIRRLTTTIIFINPLLLGKSIIKLIKILRYLCIKIGNS